MTLYSNLKSPMKPRRGISKGDFIQLMANVKAKKVRGEKEFLAHINKAKSLPLSDDQKRIFQDELSKYS